MTDEELREQELQRLYRCVFYDKQDGVDREAMFIKEVGVVVDKLVKARDAAIRIDELKRQIADTNNLKFVSLDYLEKRIAELRRESESKRD